MLFHVSKDIVSPYELTATALDDILGEQWSPCINLWDIGERCGKFIDKFLVSAKHHKDEVVAPVQRFFAFVKERDTPRWALLFAVSVAVLLRYSIGLAGYSGDHSPPEYGDYEVHRHWMEIAVGLPPSQWYQESEQEYAYKGVDYPPFCMYVHYAMGQVLKRYLPESLVYTVSRGFESEQLKFFMRSTVVTFDVLLLFTGVVYFLAHFYKTLEFSHRFTFLILAADVPCQLLIDHGHFHYNCVMLGMR